MDTQTIIMIVSISLNAIVGIILIAQINKQKAIISAMDKFMGIFKVDEVEKYVNLLKKKTELEYEEKIEKFADKITNEITNHAISIISKEVHELNTKYADAYRKLLDELKDKGLDA